ncbi:MAG TPA: cysteine--tRNA ligase, partial [Candidatus Marinimicrobia bacterium]|nr:cysteine--tRNA ligase [Candidatus Neomarinimicrobiota bacterium]
MPIRFYNTLTRKKEVFQPIKEGEVGMYTCGPTVYDYAHIGNFRTFIFEDLLKRYLLHRGYKVYHIMNITDIDDKTIKRSREENTPLGQMTDKFTGHFMDDSNWLKIIPANEYPRATDSIPKMIEMIQLLLKKEYAYTDNDGSIYFNIQSYPDYGQLTNLDLNAQRTTNRIASDEYTKDDPQDFALWKGWKEEDGDVAWDAPWGKGRPGWHIECSAMSNQYLGDHFD